MTASETRGVAGVSRRMRAAGDENRFGCIDAQYSEERLKNVWEVGVRIMSKTSHADEENKA